MAAETLRIATRTSELALWQAHHVADLLRQSDPELEVELVHVSTQGDRDQVESLRQFGGLGVFTREVQRVVLDNKADIAVHSLKDLPTTSAEGLALGAIPIRGPLFDALVLPAAARESADSPEAGDSGQNETGSESESAESSDQTDEAKNPLDRLPEGARVGTGSPRRQAQLRHLRPDLELLEIRGNVGTRLRKLDEGQYDALILAEAGLVRLGLAERISELLKPPVVFPAVSQGALGIECRAEDETTIERLKAITDPSTQSAASAERSLLRELRAGCHAPVGVQTSVADDELTLEGVVLSLDGSVRIVSKSSGPASDAEAIGARVAADLVSAGAAEVIQSEE